MRHHDHKEDIGHLKYSAFTILQFCFSSFIDSGHREHRQRGKTTISVGSLNLIIHLGSEQRVISNKDFAFPRWFCPATQ